jgi:colanic acid/amylovoran biosynthesis glycosyltransferase
MKIAFIVDVFPSLSETFILNQITGLIDLGHEVEIFAGARSTESEMHPEVKEYRLLNRTHFHNEIPQNRVYRVIRAFVLLACNLPRHPFVILRSLNFIKYGGDALSLYLFYKVCLFLSKGKFDIIQCHFGTNGNMGALLKEIGIQSKLVTMFHGYDIRRGIEKGKEIYARLFKYGDCFLSISDYTTKHLVEFGADKKKIKCHPVGVSINKFPFRWDTSNEELSDSTKILTIARLTKEKGLNCGIQAIGKLIKKNTNINLEYRIVGGGPLESELRKYAEDMEVKRFIHFRGPQSHEEIVRLIGESHVFFLPSNAEVLPVVLMEAQAAGLPVVATSVGAVSELVKDGISGFLVPERDVDAMAERLEYLIKNPEVWPKMGMNGRRHVEEFYNIKTLNSQLVEIYKQVMNS